MKSQTRIVMGMPATLQVPESTSSVLVDAIFDYFEEIDQIYSPYIVTSEVSQLRRNELKFADILPEFSEIIRLAQTAKQKTDGYFDISHNGVLDPSGIVKGWAIDRASKMLSAAEIEDYLVEIAGDMYCAGKYAQDTSWKIGIRAPFEPSKVVKELMISNAAIATSGTTERGQHIYNPFSDLPIEDIISISVIGPDVLWADIFATAAFAMGKTGIDWIESMPGYEGFLVLPDMTGIATSRFEKYIA